MKFYIGDNPISYDELSDMVVQCRDSYQGYKEPEYLIMHPKTQRNVVFSFMDQNTGTIRIERSFLSLSFKKNEPVEEWVHSIMNIYILKSEDVKEGFIVIC